MIKSYYIQYNFLTIKKLDSISLIPTKIKELNYLTYIQI